MEQMTKEECMQFLRSPGRTGKLATVLKAEKLVLLTNTPGVLDKDGKVVANDDPEKWRKKGVGKFAPVGVNPGKAVPSLKRSARKGAIMGLFLLVIVFVTSRGKNSPSPLITLVELLPFITLFVLFDLWMARKVYKKVTGREAPR